jgi:hypothetical protein
MGKIVVVVVVVVVIVEVTSSGSTVAATAALEARNVEFILTLGTLTGFTII